MSIAVNRIDLSDHDAELLAQASRLMSEALDRSEARRIALVEKKVDGSDIARLEVPPATLRSLSQILALMARHHERGSQGSWCVAPVSDPCSGSGRDPLSNSGSAPACVDEGRAGSQANYAG
jgi:hypothetical protein